MPADCVKVLIADDETPARKRLKTLLEGNSGFSIIAEAEDGDEVLKLIVEKSPDVVFLDINMPGASVFTTIPSLKNPPLVVFQTAYSEYGAKAFDIDAVDYLLKPISKERFNKSLEKIMENMKRDKPVVQEYVADKPKDVISIKTGDSITVVKISRIERISFDDGFSFIHINNDKLFSDKSLNTFEELLKGNNFYRISRTSIINLNSIKKLHHMFKGNYKVEMKSGEKIDISRRRIQGLKDLIN